MQIPLDYYRILGLPIQATAEQLRHAHRDRTLQLPRREYSEAAISARRDLIDEAYTVLSDSAQRQVYDARFLTTSYSSAGHDPDFASRSVDQEMLKTPDGNGASQSSSVSLLNLPNHQERILNVDDAPISSIEITDQQLVGALLILLELGEYELVLRLGRPFLIGGNLGLEQGQYGEPEVVGPDIVLTVALACLELGREQWQQGAYENAAESLDIGQELLLREGLFGGIRADIQADLFKLRPYRILELLALPDRQKTLRYQGIQLLESMLGERNGIDGADNDQSGLSTDDFLRFIQQLRAYLTSEEQQKLFETEAQRPSAVATYLAVYALIARGFAYRQPALLRQAKLYLKSLSNRQDIALEQSICYLLLGQTEEATRALEGSREQNALSFIRENSTGSPDLLPGLCLYVESWLQNEVFPHFRDLSQAHVSLKDFFSDDHVQAYLEALPPDSELIRQSTHSNYPIWPSQTKDEHYVIDSRNGHSYESNVPVSMSSYSSRDRYATESNTATTTIDTPMEHRNGNGISSSGSLPPAERVSRNGADSRIMPPSKSSRSRRRGWFKILQRSFNKPSASRKAGKSYRSSSLENKTINPAGYSDRRRTTKTSGLKLDRILFLAGIGIVSLVILWMALSRVLGWLGDAFAGPQLRGEQLSITVNEPFVAIPSPEEIKSAEIEAAEATGELTPEVAENIVVRWFDAKSEAMGDSHNIDALDEILTGSVLSRWQGQAQEAARSNWYWTYEHPSLEVTDIEWSEDLPEQGSIDANVQEVGQYYVTGQLRMDETYDSELSVRYGVVREDDAWKIESIQVLN